MRRIVLSCLVLLLADLPSGLFAQGYPGGGIPPITGSGGRTQQHEEIPSAPPEVKPDKAAAKRLWPGTKPIEADRRLSTKGGIG